MSRGHEAEPEAVPGRIVTVQPGQTLIVRYREKIMPSVYGDVDKVIAATQSWLTAEEARIEAKLPGVKVIFVAGDELAVYGPAPNEDAD